MRNMERPSFSIRLPHVTVVVLLLVSVLNCSDPPFDPGAVPDDYTAQEIAGFIVEARTTARGDRVSTRATITNATDTIARFATYARCPVGLTIHTSRERTQPPVWSAAGITYCEDLDTLYTLAPRQQVEYKGPTTSYRILGDSLPQTRYFFVAYLAVVHGVAPHRTETAILKSGNALLRR